jgi:hypothetical protein
MIVIATVFRDDLEELKEDLHEQYGNVLLKHEEIREKFLDIE